MDTWGEYGLSWTGPDVADADVPPLLQQYGYNAMTEVGSCEDADFGEAECCNSNQKNTEAACAQRCSSFCQKHYLHRTANDDQHLLTICVANKNHRKCQDGKKFIIPYVVYEKTFPCNSYPPDENVTFFDISVECDGKGALGGKLRCVGVVFVAVGIHLALICPQIAPKKCNGQRM